MLDGMPYRRNGPCGSLVDVVEPSYPEESGPLMPDIARRRSNQSNLPSPRRCLGVMIGWQARRKPSARQRPTTLTNPGHGLPAWRMAMGRGAPGEGSDRPRCPSASATRSSLLCNQAQRTHDSRVETRKQGRVHPTLSTAMFQTEVTVFDCGIQLDPVEAPIASAAGLREVEIKALLGLRRSGCLATADLE